MRLFTKIKKNKTETKKILYVDFFFQNRRHRKSLKLDDNSRNRVIAQSKIIPEMLVKLHQGVFFKKEMPTVDEFKEISFEIQSSNRSELTQKDYRSKYNKNLKPYFGDKFLNEIKGIDISFWQNELLELDYDPKTIRSYRGVLSTIFDDAIKAEFIEKNPVRLASKISTRRRINNSTRKISPFSLDEIKQLLQTTENEQMKNLYALLFFTGMRGGEAMGLQWRHVNFINKKIDVEQQIGRGILGPPKWESYRTIEIIDALIPYLQSQFELTSDFNSYVFLNKQNSHYWDISKIREQYWKKDLKKAMIAYRNIHQTRHTFCSTLISAGEDINYVSKLAGHSTTKTTLEKYSKFIPNKKDDFGKIFKEISL